MPTRTVTARTGLALLLAAAGALAGCSGDGSKHGKYTQEHLSEAQVKMDMLKSGTQWQMANQQFLSGDLNKSLKSVDQSLALNPKVSKSHLLRGRIMLEKGRLEDARNEFLECEKLDPNFVDAQYYLGIVHERVAQYDEALARYRKAMEIDAANAQYVVAAAEMLVSQGRLDEAETLLTERRQFLQYNAAIRQATGHIATLRADHKRAVELYREALLLAPGDRAITEDLVQAHISCAQFADAESLLARLLSKDENKDRRDLKSLRARCLLALDRPLEARTLLQELTADAEGSADLRSWIELGNVAAMLKDRATLRQCAQRVSAMAPDRFEGHMLRAMHARLDNRLDNALQAADLAAARSGKDVSPYVFKALVLQDLQRFAEARATLDQARQINPADQKVAALQSSMDRLFSAPAAQTIAAPAENSGAPVGRE